MKFFLGLLIGLFLAVGIAAGAAYLAFDNLGDWGDYGERDKSKDVTQQYDVVDFDKIDIGGVFELDVAVGGDFSVELSGAPEEMERVEVTVENGKLVLDQRRRERGERRRWRNQGLEATITLPSLTAMDFSGVGEVDVIGIDAAEFDINFSGVGDFELSGTCESLEADISGIGDFDASDLKCKTADVDVSGIGDASVYASESIDISVTGIGSVTVYGSPAQVEKSDSFLSRIEIRE